MLAVPYTSQRHISIRVVYGSDLCIPTPISTHSKSFRNAQSVRRYSLHTLTHSLSDTEQTWLCRTCHVTKLTFLSHHCHRYPLPNAECQIPLSNLKLFQANEQDSAMPWTWWMSKCDLSWSPRSNGSFTQKSLKPLLRHMQFCNWDMHTAEKSNCHCWPRPHKIILFRSSGGHKSVATLQSRT